LQNLVENALRFLGDQPHPRIQIGKRDHEDGPVFFVEDNGIGIDPQYHETVFGLFNTLDAGASGTGIGLALVRRIIEAHGGRAWIESAGKGEGTRVCFTLPGAVPQGE
jgi:signal transduction histidine kinase